MELITTLEPPLRESGNTVSLSHFNGHGHAKLFHSTKLGRIFLGDADDFFRDAIAPRQFGGRIDPRIVAKARG